MCNAPKRTVVFDLDDTLYDEADYVRSGKLAVAKCLQNCFASDISENLLNDSGDFLATACQAFGLAPAVKNSLLWVYRMHQPSIALRTGVAELWSRLKSAGLPICILTDGRAITQRLKIAALGLIPDGVYISEAIGAEKPSPLGFQMVMLDFPAAEYVYIADNPAKDFVAPHALGWRTCGITPRKSSIHVAINGFASESIQPETWVNDFDQVESWLLHLEAKA
jgi:putative hydrolase of the HAD superfamily